MDAADTFHAGLIRDLGGKAWLARQLGLDRGVLAKWHERGIPYRYWPRVIALADEAHIAVTLEDLDRTKPATSARAA